ncbi:MAG TPA: hypothetical protein VEL82_05710 [Thermoplasmata archaeon]|nr:hypothetical protein [Thermoplasmata archaeon]
MPEESDATVLRSSRAPSDRPRPVLGVIVAVVAVLVVVSFLYAIGVFSPAAPASSPGTGPDRVVINSIEWDLTGSLCSGDPTLSIAAGTDAPLGSSINVTDGLVNQAAYGTCTFSSPTASSGFLVTSSNAPITVGAGANQTLHVQLQVPAASWSGVLIVALSVSTAQQSRRIRPDRS